MPQVIPTKTDPGGNIRPEQTCNKGYRCWRMEPSPPTTLGPKAANTCLTPGCTPETLFNDPDTTETGTVALAVGPTSQGVLQNPGEARERAQHNPPGRGWVEDPGSTGLLCLSRGSAQDRWQRACGRWADPAWKAPKCARA